LKRKWFCDFRFQKIINFYGSRLNFWKTCKDSKKWLYYLLDGMIIDKVKKNVTKSWSCKKWQTISWPLGHFAPALPPLGLNGNKFQKDSTDFRHWKLISGQRRTYLSLEPNLKFKSWPESNQKCAIIQNMYSWIAFKNQFSQTIWQILIRPACLAIDFAVQVNHLGSRSA
jgi:hypothetical protein